MVTKFTKISQCPGLYLELIYNFKGTNQNNEIDSLKRKGKLPNDMKTQGENLLEQDRYGKTGVMFGKEGSTPQFAR